MRHTLLPPRLRHGIQLQACTSKEVLDLQGTAAMGRYWKSMRQHCIEPLLKDLAAMTSDVSVEVLSPVDNVLGPKCST